jgi:folate-binding protein YgfZ
MTELLCADRSERGKLSFSGPQRAWFLHQVLTQAFEDVSAGEARDAAMITVHGRMTGYVETLATDDTVLCHFEPELRPALLDQISRYVFATRVDIEDVTEAYGLVLVTGPAWRDALGSSTPGALLHETRSLGVEAGYAWLSRAEVDPGLDALEAVGARRATEEELEAIRIEHGVPRWGRDMDEKTFPQEAGVDTVAVHYDKGCYLGQEAMAKIHFRGKVNRGLVKLVGEGPLTVGAEVTLDGDRVGRVTSAADGRALAMVKRSVSPGSSVRAGSIDATVTD